MGNLDKEAIMVWIKYQLIVVSGSFICFSNFVTAIRQLR